MIRRFFSLRSFVGLVLVLTVVGYQFSRGKYFYGFLWYIVCNQFFMKFTTILHPQRTKFRMTEKGDDYSHHLIAHRGGGWHAPENTIQAFKRAAAKGCHMLELDVRITKDKKIIVCHDEDFERLCGDRRKVSEVTFSELPKFKQQMPMHFSKSLKDGEFLNYERAKSDQESFDLLEDILKAFPDMPMSIEVKDKGNREAAELTIALSRKYKRHEITLFGSDEAWWTREMQTMDPTICTSAGATDVIKVYFCHWLGLLPFLHIEREAFLFPYQTAAYIKMQHQEIVESSSLTDKIYKFVSIYVQIAADKTMNAAITHLQNRNIYTCYWVINDSSELRDLLRNSSVEGVMTDRIDNLQRHFMTKARETENVAKHIKN